MIKTNFQVIRGNRQWIFLTALVFLGLTAAGCAGISVSSDYDSNANFTGFKTYDWAGLQPITGNPRLDNDILHERIRNAVDREFAAKGYQKIAGGSPDFKVAYHVGLEDKIDVMTFNYYDYGYPAYYGTYGFRHQMGAWPASQTSVYQYEEGTLILDIVDPATKKLIWRGTAKAEVSVSDSPEKKEARIDKAVHKILLQFPPKS
ncbi:MAG TPA: DUF4136 domain-containing protein [bacterium]|nr:DUF4136 domain-containing protein [bacterium]